MSDWPETPEESGCGCGDFTCPKCCPPQRADTLAAYLAAHPDETDLNELGC